MKYSSTFLAVGMILQLSAGYAFAAESPNALWQAGQYDQAIAAGEAENTPDGWSIAARAAISDMTLRIPLSLDCVHRAESIARKAIEADPKDALPHVYLALALGYEARIVGMLEAQRQGLGDQSKHEVEAALAIDPHNAFAMATLGGWNIDAVRIGGLLAKWTYGASIDTGIAKYTQATALDPANIVIHYQFALSLASTDTDRYRKDIETQLSLALAGKPGSAYDLASQKRAGVLLNLLKAGNQQALMQQVWSDMGISQSDSSTGAVAKE